jgi:hypothetical protein
MGYYIQSQKINIVLDEYQQEQIFNLWTNPSKEIKEEQPGLEWLEKLFMKDRSCSNIKEIFDMIHIKYVENENGLELTYHSGNLRGQLSLFEAVAHIINPSSFMSFMGEDGSFIGLFFNGSEVIDYKSNRELEMLVSSLTLRNDLEESLPVKQNGLTQTKIKV